MHVFMEYSWKQGERTPVNQDSLAFCQMVVRRRRCVLGAVCDGIGSMPGSEEAGGFVTEQLLQWFCREGPGLFGAGSRKKRICNAGIRLLHRIHLELVKRCTVQEEDGTRILPRGTTVTALLVVESRYYWWHAGDSRLYYAGKRKPLKQLTTDHVRQGKLEKCVGSVAFRGASTGTGRIRGGASFLLCTDGFYRRLPVAWLERFLQEGLSRTEAQTGRMLRDMILQNTDAGEKDDSTALYIAVKNKKTWRKTGRKILCSCKGSRIFAPQKQGGFV